MDLGLASPSATGLQQAEAKFTEVTGLLTNNLIFSRHWTTSWTYVVRSAIRFYFFIDQSHFYYLRYVCIYDLYKNTWYFCYWFWSTGQTTTTRDTTALICYIWHCLQRLLFHGHNNWCLTLCCLKTPWLLIPEVPLLLTNMLSQVFIFRREKWNTPRPWRSQVARQQMFLQTNPRTHACTQGATA